MDKQPPRFAVVGMACRFPGGNDSPSALWRYLCAKGDAIRAIPNERWSSDRFYSPRPQTPGRMTVKRAVSGWGSPSRRRQSALVGTQARATPAPLPCGSSPWQPPIDRQDWPRGGVQYTRAGIDALDAAFLDEKPVAMLPTGRSIKR